MKILITGAHFTPAVAVIEELKKINNIEIIYVGRKTTQEGDSYPSVESKILPAMGVKFTTIVTGRLQRMLTVNTIPSLLKIPVGFLHAIYIILTQKPEVILSFGGYVAVPIVIAGWLFSVPIIIHEQTLVSGLANKISSYFADKIAVSFEENEYKKEKVILTGNPLRSTVLSVNSGSNENIYQNLLRLAKKENKPVLLITGGNQGSHFINNVVEKTLEKLTKLAFVIHVTGGNKYRDFERLVSLQNDRYIVKKWIDSSWGEIMGKADLIVSRAGINTLSEAAYLGKPILLIPIPYLYKDEQNENAKFFANLGLAQILLQNELSEENFISKIKFMLNNLNNLKEKAKTAKKVIIPDAAKRLALETVLLGTKDKI